MRLAALAVVALLALAGCGAAPRSSGVTSSAAPAPTTTRPAPTTSPAPPIAAVGDTVTNGGVAVTVLSAGPVDTVELNESGFQAGSGYEEYTVTEPDPGGRFVAVQTHIVNNGRVSLDLTCSLPIDTILVDAQQREFDPIDSLHQLRGNPECNYQLQPGFESDMTYVYMVPESAAITGWVFADISEDFVAESYSAFRFSA
jgi:CheY-like chemotaxis protein